MGGIHCRPIWHALDPGLLGDCGFVWVGRHEGPIRTRDGVGEDGDAHCLGHSGTLLGSLRGGEDRHRSRRHRLRASVWTGGQAGRGWQGGLRDHFIVRAQGLGLHWWGGLRGKKFLEGARAVWVDGGSAVASICRVTARWGSCLGARAHDECREGVLTLTFTLTLLVRVTQNFKNVEVRAVGKGRQWRGHHEGSRHWRT